MNCRMCHNWDECQEQIYGPIIQCYRVPGALIINLDIKGLIKLNDYGRDDQRK